MARLIQKSGFIKRNGAAGYMVYIATRDGVDKYDNGGAVTIKQTYLIGKLLSDFPDSAELFEYDDYLASPTADNASAFIYAAIDMNAHTMSDTDGYMRYIALRPRAERHGEHGLFGAENNVDLQDAQDRLRSHGGNVWTIIYSLSREDATRLGYDNADAWRQLLRAKSAVLSKAMRIPETKFRWYAAFHDEGHHPHIHMMVWSDDGESGFLTREGITTMRSALTNVIFKDELSMLYVQKDVAYKELTAAAKQSMTNLRESSEHKICDNTHIEQMLMNLSFQLAAVSGKKQYGYLPHAVKKSVDEIVDAMSELPAVAKCYEDWNALRDAVESYYKDTPRQHLSLSEQKEFRAVKNIVVREAVRLGESLFSESQFDVTDSEISKAKLVLHDEQAPPEVKRAALSYLHNCAEKGNSAAKLYTDPSGTLRMTELTNCVIQLICGFAGVFGSNAVAPMHPSGMRIDSKRRQKLMELKAAHGHRLDDHDDYMTMKTY